MRCVGRSVEEEVKETWWWWNDEVDDAVSRRRDVHKAMCRNSTEVLKQEK